jgi:hypothetical protein
VREWTKEGCREVRRTYDYPKFDDHYFRNDLVARDTVLKELPNVPMPEIQFRKSPGANCIHSPPRDLASIEDIIGRPLPSQ